MMDASNIKVAVCVTVFNEEELEVRRTLEGISLNMGSWNLKRDEVIVSIVADGRVNLSKSLKVLPCAAAVRASRTARLCGHTRGALPLASTGPRRRVWLLQLGGHVASRA